MRLSRLACFGFMIIALPAMAQPGEKIIAAHYTCRQSVPCEDRSDGFSSAQWAQAGTACAQEAFGVSKPDGIIDDVAGLNSSNCLTTKSGAGIKNGGPTLLPQCCVVSVPTGGCAISCNLEQQ